MATAWIDGLPNSIRVGTFDCAIRKMDRPWGTRHIIRQTKDGFKKVGYRWADYCEETHEMRFRRHMPSRAFAFDTVIHEIMHAIWHAYRLKRVQKEENIVYLMANGLTQVLFDNPQFFAWFSEMIAVIHKRRRRTPR